MTNKLDPGDRLFVGVILAIVGLVGLVLIYRSLDYTIIMGDVQGLHSFHGSGFSILLIIIITLFVLVTLLGIYLVYDIIKKDKRNN
jgi:hypothetical protein